MNHQESMAHMALTIAAQNLISRAQHSGFVVTITTEPGTPLAMGNYIMQANVRQARNAPPCENVTFNAPTLWPGDLATLHDTMLALGNALQALLAIDEEDIRVGRWATKLDALRDLCGRLAGSSQPYHSNALRSIIIERCRVMGGIDWTPETEDGMVNEELAAMASYYAMPDAARDWPAQETGYGATFGEAIRPHGWVAYPAGRRAQLVKSAALSLAEIERIDRQAQPGKVADYPELSEAAPLEYSGDGACAYVCFAANGNCIIWSTNQQQVADAAAKYGRPYIPLYGPKAGEVASLAASAVLAERARQINAEGWTPEHDDSRINADLAYAAAGYALEAADNTIGLRGVDHSHSPIFFPETWRFKHASPRRMLVKAAALTLAEIERLDRAAAAEKGRAQ